MQLRVYPSPVYPMGIKVGGVGSIPYYIYTHTRNYETKGIENVKYT